MAPRICSAQQQVQTRTSACDYTGKHTQFQHVWIPRVISLCGCSSITPVKPFSLWDGNTVWMPFRKCLIHCSSHPGSEECHSGPWVFHTARLTHVLYYYIPRSVFRLYFEKIFKGLFTSHIGRVSLVPWSQRVSEWLARTFCPLFFLLDAILNMVNNIAANVLGGASELEGELETGGTHLSHSSRFLFSDCPKSPTFKCCLWPFCTEVFSFYLSMQ